MRVHSAGYDVAVIHNFWDLFFSFAGIWVASPVLIDRSNFRNSILWISARSSTQAMESVRDESGDISTLMCAFGIVECASAWTIVRNTAVVYAPRAQSKMCTSIYRLFWIHLDLLFFTSSSSPFLSLVLQSLNCVWIGTATRNQRNRSKKWAESWI